ncbi:MAG: hypothetical protein ACRCUY_03610 [Thermoguttaceae bacterium]
MEYSSGEFCPFLGDIGTNMMNEPSFTVTLPESTKEVLGYLNFSSNLGDVRFFAAMNTVFSAFVSAESDAQSRSSRSKGMASKRAKTSRLPDIAIRVLDHLSSELARLSKESEAFRVDDRAGQVIQIVRDHLLPGYRKFHSELLFHQNDDLIFNSFFLARAFDAILSQKTPWTSIDAVTRAAILELNDFIGYRPVPILEGIEKHQPYQNEWVAPVPLYLKDAGVAVGKYQKIVEQAIEIIKNTDSEILREACFDLERLEELSLDPRAYDFDHPVNRKPNYHFGLWDPLRLDSSGYYRRFVVHQVTLEGISRRLEQAYMGESDAATIPEDELLFEAGAVLAGTMLMGSGVCGDSPQTHDSETSLGTLMPIIANYRDKFYKQLVGKVPEKMESRIHAEEKRLFQPFGGCRQDLNRQMSKRRADQLQRMHLARVFARMGYFDAAKYQANVISVASARIMTTIDCLITTSHLQIDQGDLVAASAQLPKIESLLRTGISCGAIVDPWTILGFGGNYSLFHSAENSIHDHRVDDLISLLEEMFDLYSRLQKEAAADGKSELQLELSDQMSDLAAWWDQFASTEVSSLESFSGSEAWESAAVVSTALSAWHKAGTASGDVAFWNRHVERFKSTKAYVLLSEALLDQGDMVASMALMMYWLSNAEQIPLIEGDYSFHPIVIRWMEQLWKTPKVNDDDSNSRSTIRRNQKPVPPMTPEERWNLTKKFFDYLEVNADEYWRIPEIDLPEEMFDGGEDGNRKKSSSKRNKNSKKKNNRKGDEWKADDSDSDEDLGLDLDDVFDSDSDLDFDEHSGAIDSIYSAAYENVVYHDSADDGVDDDMLDATPPGSFNDEDDFEIIGETDRISDRLTFLMTVAKLLKYATEKVASTPECSSNEKLRDDVREYVHAWLDQEIRHDEGMEQLLKKVSQYIVPPPRGTSDSLLEYDRHRGIKEILIDRIVWTQVELRDTQLILQSYLGESSWSNVTEEWHRAVLRVNHAVFQNKVKNVRAFWPEMLSLLNNETILYVPTSRGGVPSAIVRCRCIQQVIVRLMEYAPRLGLITEVFQLLDTIQIMEEHNAICPGAITEFDRLVETATRAICQCIAISSKKWKFRAIDSENNASDIVLVDYMEQIIEQLLSCWLSHSRQIRISPVETLLERSRWNAVRDFIQRYGHDIFTQQFMGFGNLRAMLHQGVESHIKSLQKLKEDDGETEIASTLLNDIEQKIVSMEDAVSHLEIIFECIAENYSEYVDYNSTTTHSDHGEKLYMLIDMLRVQIGYERISWNLKPVYWVHDAMIRAGCDHAAMLWEIAVGKRSINAAEEHLRHYNRLSEKYGMWIPSIHERLQERFVRPLQIARMCGLVPKAIREARTDGPKTTFNILYQQTEEFAKEPMGVGFEMPEWLTALQEEAMATSTDINDDDKEDDIFSDVPHFEQTCLTRAQIEKVIDLLAKRERFE